MLALYRGVMMSKIMSRPDNLPDYQNPPLNEVVLGVQFAPAQGYQQIRAGEVWNLYRGDYPLVEEQPPLPPTFETFGLPHHGNALNFGFIAGAKHDRFWFLSQEKDELIQFQQDRLLHNWRKVKDRNNSYPRFERIIESFETELWRLEKYFDGLCSQSIKCNQAEISYVNHIPLDCEDSPSQSGDWLRFCNFGDIEPDDVSLVVRRALRETTGAPYGRMICEVKTAWNPKGGRILIVTLTVRGAPVDQSISSALDFLKRGRDVIVEEFTSITTDSAHKLWGRVR